MSMTISRQQYKEAVEKGLRDVDDFDLIRDIRRHADTVTRVAVGRFMYHTKDDEVGCPVAQVRSRDFWELNPETLSFATAYDEAIYNRLGIRLRFNTRPQILEIQD